MITAKTYSSLEKIFPQVTPTLVEESGCMLKNERYNFQVNLYNDAEPTSVCVMTVESDIKEFVSVRMTLCVPGTANNYHDSDDFVIFKPGEDARLYPDVLMPLNGVNFGLKGYQNNAFWVTVHAKEGLPVGEHKITFKFVDYTGVSAECSYSLEVLDSVLPENDLMYTNWMHYDGIAREYRTEVFSEEFYGYFDSFLRTAVEHGLTVLYTPIFTPALDTYDGGERITAQLVGITRKGKDYSFDFSLLDYFIDFALERGVKYLEMSHLATQWGGRSCPKIMATTENGYERIFGWETCSFGEDYQNFLSQFLPALDKFLKAKGVDKITLFHISDEPQKEHYEDFKKVYNFIRSLIRDYKIMDASGDKTNALGLDYPVIGLAHIDDADELGDEFWVYYCCHPVNKYKPNRFLNMPSQRNRILGFQLYETNRKGFLHWGFNFYNGQYSRHALNPFLETDARGYFPSGDSFVVYPGMTGALDSLRLEVFYEGIQDRLALIALEKKIGREEVLTLLHAEGVRGYTEYPRDAVWHKNFRQKINRLIAQKE